MADYYPDSYQFISISSDKDDNKIIKLFAVWHGGYLTGDAWKLNSGVTKIEQSSYQSYIVSGYSGSQYVVNKHSTKLSSYGEAVLRGIVEKAAAQGINVQRISLEEAIREVL